MRKLKVGFITSSILVKTGFSNHIKRLLPYLYKTNKYELFHLNQGMPDNHPDFQRFPWKNEGVFKPGQFDHIRFNNPNEEEYKRVVSYGNLAVKDFILNNELDVVIHIEDIWSSTEEMYLKSEWWPVIKDNFLQSTTADSLPILPNFKVWAEKCKNIWFWSSFAEKALKNENLEKYGHIKTVPGCVGKDEYKPISLYEKNELRKKFNIDPNTIIFMQLGRNQPRKLYGRTLESFAKFKKRNSSANAKLLFHCSWQEGWPLDKMIEDNGLKKEDVLTTYFCQKCGDWEIKPHVGENLECKNCQEKKSQITAGIQSKISNEDIGKIYGISDAVVSVFTSGGLEYTNIEACLCELPLLCSDYSAGEDFTSKDFIFSLDGSFTDEIGTGFKKHVPNLNTMIKFYEKIYSMSYENRKKIGKKAREWAIQTFDISIIAKKYEEFIDSCPFIDWEAFKNRKIESKNPNAIIPNIEDNKEWLKTLYKEILKMDVTDDDSGLVSWLNNLQNGQSRQDIENFFRNTGHSENLKLNLNNQSFESLIDNNGNKKLLIVLKESIGDIIISTAIIDSIKKAYPEYDLYFGTSPQYFDILSGNPNIYKCLPWIDVMDSEIWATGQGKSKGLFDAYINLGITTQRQLNYLTNNRIKLL